MLKAETPEAKAWASLCTEFQAQSIDLRRQNRSLRNALVTIQAGRIAEPLAAAVATVALNQDKDMSNGNPA